MPSDPLTGAVTAKILSFSPSPFGLVFRGYETGTHSIQSQREANDGQLYGLSIQPLGGNVLLGTTTDNGARLQVNGTGSFTGQLTLTTGSSQPLVLNGSNNQYLFISSVGAEAMTQYYNPTAGNWYTGIRTSAGIGSTSSYHIYSSLLPGDVFVCNTDGSSRFVGSVGIGVAPATNLHVEGGSVSYGQVRIKSSGAIGGETSIHYGRTSQTLEQGWTIGQGVAGIGDPFGFYTGGNVRLMLTTGGNVLIGTTTDATGKLQVNGSIYATSFFESSSVDFKDILETNPITSLNIDVIKYKRTNIDVDDVRYGYSAQQINLLMPELTNKDITAVKYLDVHTLLIAELQKEIKQLKEKLK